MVEFDPVLVHEWLRRSARRFPNKVALVCGQERWTYEALDRYTDHLALNLQQMGLQRQDRVVILLDNSSEAVLSLYATLKAGGVFIILPGSIKGRKLRYILSNSSAKFVITHTNKGSVVNDAFGGDILGRKLVWVGSKQAIPDSLVTASVSWDDIFINVPDQEEHDGCDFMFPHSIDVDLATLIYTSGSTGEPKGVMSTHHNMISAARSIIQYIGNEENDVILNVLPLSFDYGLYQVIMAFMFGGTVVLEKSFLFLHNILQRIAKERVTGFPIVPTIVAMLLRMQDLDKYDLRILRYMTNTGAALPVEHIRKLHELFPNVMMFSMFGLTECKRVSFLPPNELDCKPGSVGKAIPNCEVFVVDGEGDEVETGQTGELIIRGSNIMQGYWNDAELTNNAYKSGKYPADRFLYSGDFFRTDEEGYLYFLGRKDDMIKSKGERISAKEVENTLHNMDGVAEVAVIGVPDEILGQAIKVFIVPSSEAQLTDKAVLRYCSANMESFMVPKYVVFVDELPKTPNGKIDKKQLKSVETGQYSY